MRAELAELFAFHLPVWEIILRGSAIYWFLLLLFRFVLRRDAGSLGIADLLFVVLIADASSNAMQGEYRSIAEGFVLLATLAVWNYTLDWGSYRSKAIKHLMEPPPEPLIRDGKMVWKALKRNLITEDELKSKLREKGIEKMDAIRLAYLESDGQISVLERAGTQSSADKQHDQPAPRRPGAG
ncbi:DUF421 domain-containing protein [Variovorax paradoxus]|nr:YetF domain-containing protein [Variovorax paradoxus]MBT2302971.1 DUF421 domain-containing protein [Variovorax paradoxus]